ncbi:glutamate racemase [Patescibacteria group bacterium]
MIALFDSGFGGLTVLKPLIKKLPQYDYLYLGDNARTPYGTRSQETVIRYSEQAVEHLFDQGAELIITACNTVSALALRHLQQKYKDRKILGVIRPLVEQAAESTKSKRIGVVGTRGTINSNSYNEELAKLDPKIKVYSQACPLLVPFIEEGWHNKPEALKILKTYLRPLKSKNTDTLILGCTHYPLMHKYFAKYMGKNVKVPEPGKVVADSLTDYLERHPEIETRISKGSKREYSTTDCIDNFKQFANRELKLNIDKVSKVKLWQ